MASQRRTALLRWIAKLNPFAALGSLIHRLRNWRRLRDRRLDYILIRLPGAMPALPEARGWLQKRVLGAGPISLWDFDRLLQRIADDPRPRGIVLYIAEPTMSLADLQTLRGALLRFRERGKRIVIHAQTLSLAGYYLASVGDEILLQPGGEVFTLGLRQRAIFLKDALASIGIRFDVVAISPFKSAFDQLARSDISPEGRQQIDWLLDSRYEMLVEDIAQGRKLSTEAVREMIDRAPHLDQAALDAGYVDGLLHEDGLADHLQAEHLLTLPAAQKKLIQRRRPRAESAVAILKVSGLMVQGESSTSPLNLPLPFIDSERAGDRTVVQQVRQLMRAEHIKAVVLFIDSGGGSALGAEAMTAALNTLNQTKPIVVYMNGAAASGGYYIATASRWIVAQPGTITGSIGVILAKPVMGDLYDKLNIHSVAFARGANADLLDEQTSFSPVQRQQMERSIQHIYGQFIDRVAAARSLSTEAVDAVGGGRVWTGKQALAHGLVDELGDLSAALKKARSLAGLPDSTPVVLWGSKGSELPPQLIKSNALAYGLENVRALSSRAQLLMDWRLD